MSEKRLYDVIDKEEPRGQSVSYQGIPCTARHCCTNLNRLTEENEQLKKEYKIAIDEMVTDYKKLEEENEKLKSENKKLEQQYQNLVNAIVKTCNDLGKENIYLGDFDICKRITEYEKELFDDD